MKDAQNVMPVGMLQVPDVQQVMMDVHQDNKMMSSSLSVVDSDADDMMVVDDM